MKILIIESEKEHAAKLIEILDALGHEYICSQSGLDGLKLIERQHFDLVFVSVELTDKNGYLICKALREIPIFETIPIVLSSSSERATYYFEKHKLLWHRANNYLKKPYKKEEVENILNKFVQSMKALESDSEKVKKLEAELKKQKMVHELLVKELADYQRECKKLKGSRVEEKVLSDDDKEEFSEIKLVDEATGIKEKEKEEKEKKEDEWGLDEKVAADWDKETKDDWGDETVRKENKKDDKKEDKKADDEWTEVKDKEDDDWKKGDW